MSDVRLTKIRMSGGTRHEHITHVASDTQIWTRAVAVSAIEAGLTSFYVIAGRLRADVRVVDSNPKYLRTYADGSPTDNLLELPKTA